MSIPVKESPLIDACPPSISDDSNVQAICTALDRQFGELIDDINQTIILPAIDQITDHDLLDLLGWQFHVDYWDANQTVEVKQHLIKSSLDWHTRKGTVDLIQQVCDLAFGPGVATIQEWFEYKFPFPPNYPIDDPEGVGTWHDRYKFRVLFAEDVLLDPATEARVRELIRNYKPVTRWDEGFIRPRNCELDIFWGAAMLPWKRITIEAPTSLPPDPEYPPFAQDYELEPPVLGQIDLQAGLVELERAGADKIGPGDTIEPITIARQLTLKEAFMFDCSSAVTALQMRNVTAGVAGRWGLVKLGNNNFVIRRFSATNSVIGDVFTIGANNGIVNFDVPFTVNGDPWPIGEGEQEIQALETMAQALRARIELLERS